MLEVVIGADVLLCLKELVGEVGNDVLLPICLPVCLQLSIHCILQQSVVELLAVHQELGEHDLRNAHALVLQADIAELQQFFGNGELLSVGEGEYS